jgi:hypothetical protein
LLQVNTKCVTGDKRTCEAEGEQTSVTKLLSLEEGRDEKKFYNEIFYINALWCPPLWKRDM